MFKTPQSLVHMGLRMQKFSSGV